MADKKVVQKNHVMTSEKLNRFLTATCGRALPVMIAGMPGVGKTEIVKQVAKKLGFDLLIMHPVVSDPTDAKGMPWIHFDDESGKPKAVFVPFAELEQMVDAKGPTIVLLDDLGQAPPVVQAAFMQLILGRQINGTKISKHIVFIACTNRKEDRAGVSGILEPVKSRFVSIVELVPDIKSWSAWAVDYGIEPEVIAFARYRPWVLEGGEGGFKASADMTNSPVPRTMEWLDELVKLNLDADLRGPAYTGAVGAGAASEYLAFERIIMNLPNMNEVYSDPDNAAAPKDRAVMYAMLGVFHRNMSKTNIDNIYRYLELHFPLEMQAVFHLDIEKYNKSLVKTKGYINWSVENGEAIS
jgi:MoxR-like ATPase